MEVVRFAREVLGVEQEVGLGPGRVAASRSNLHTSIVRPQRAVHTQRNTHSRHYPLLQAWRAQALLEEAVEEARRRGYLAAAVEAVAVEAAVEAVEAVVLL